MKRLLLIGFAIIVTGCATPPPLEFTPDHAPQVTERIDAELRSLTVKTARESDQVGEGVNWFQVENMVGHQFIVTSTGTGVPITRQWETALNTALTESILFTDDTSKRVSLFVDIKQIEWQGLATVYFDVLAHYRLMDRKTGEDLYAQDIASRGSARTGQAFVGAVRSRIALVEAIKLNIQKFLDSITEEASSINSRIQGLSL